jgi:N6-L-threonylcarbamoyladenine synthase
MIVLGIESSCDETAASVIRGENGKVTVLTNIVSSQIKIHKKYGGVIPEVAAREHVTNILPVIDKALRESGCLDRKKAHEKRIVSAPKIDSIAVTFGPGLITSLMVGVETAKSLSYAWNVPLLEINHIEGHIYANFIDKAEDPKQIFPAIVLIVSGGHTSLILMKGHGKYQLLGETRDDAAGEAFDKAAKLMDLGYPGGPIISKYAKKFDKLKIENDKLKISLPRPMIDSKNFEFSFSGLKTALLYQLKKDTFWKKRIPEYAKDFQQSIIDVLVEKTIKAVKLYNAKTIMLGGGVSANLQLREQMKKAVMENMPEVNYWIPKYEHTTDNAAMIATAGYFKALAGKYSSWKKIKTDSSSDF